MKPPLCNTGPCPSLKPDAPCGGLSQYAPPGLATVASRLSETAMARPLRTPIPGPGDSPPPGACLAALFRFHAFAHYSKTIRIRKGLLHVDDAIPEALPLCSPKRRAACLPRNCLVRDNPAPARGTRGAAAGIPNPWSCPCPRSRVTFDCCAAWADHRRRQPGLHRRDFLKNFPADFTTSMALQETTVVATPTAWPRGSKPRSSSTCTPAPASHAWAPALGLPQQDAADRPAASRPGRCSFPTFPDQLRAPDPAPPTSSGATSPAAPGRAPAPHARLRHGISANRPGLLSLPLDDWDRIWRTSTCCAPSPPARPRTRSAWRLCRAHDATKSRSSSTAATWPASGPGMPASPWPTLQRRRFGPFTENVPFPLDQRSTPACCRRTSAPWAKPWPATT